MRWHPLEGAKGDCWPALVKIGKTSEKMAGFHVSSRDEPLLSWRGRPCGRQQVCRLGRRVYRKTLEKNEPRGENRSANLLHYRASAQVRLASRFKVAGTLPRAVAWPKPTTRWSGRCAPGPTSGLRLDARQLYCLTPLWPKSHATDRAPKNEQIQRENGTGFCCRVEFVASHLPPRAHDSRRRLGPKRENRARKPAEFDLRFLWRWLKSRIGSGLDRTDYTGSESEKCEILRENRHSLRGERSNYAAFAPSAKFAPRSAAQSLRVAANPEAR